MLGLFLCLSEPGGSISVPVLEKSMLGGSLEWCATVRDACATLARHLRELPPGPGYPAMADSGVRDRFGPQNGRCATLFLIVLCVL